MVTLTGWGVDPIGMKQFYTLSILQPNDILSIEVPAEIWVAGCTGVSKSDLVSWKAVEWIKWLGEGGV